MAPELREEIGSDPEYLRCALLGLQFGPCDGRITREHSLIYKGSKIQEKWAIIPCCAAHHGVDFFLDAPTEAPKEVREWVALNRASDEDLSRFNRAVPSYPFQRDRLNAKFGPYVPPLVPEVSLTYSTPKPRPMAKRAPVDEFEREARLFARDNGCSLDAARLMLETLV